MSPLPPPFLRLGCFLAVAALLGACNPPTGEVREWSADDHDQPASVQNAAPARPKSSAAPPMSNEELVELAWQKNCASCHGPTGRGDGPQGAMMRAADLTRADWQGKVSDSEMADVIRNGRNKMPNFANLPPNVITGLVHRIREHKQP
ncbi:MAG: cytochrome c [Byssovorax sp.]